MLMLNTRVKRLTQNLLWLDLRRMRFVVVARYLQPAKLQVERADQLLKRIVVFTQEPVRHFLIQTISYEQMWPIVVLEKYDENFVILSGNLNKVNQAAYLVEVSVQNFPVFINSQSVESDLQGTWSFTFYSFWLHLFWLLRRRRLY